MTKMPPFAEAWMNQWRAAGPELERVRREELRALDAPLSGVPGAVPGFGHAVSGLVEQQAWFMRAMLLAAYAKAK
jgi:hypothetical protein